MEKIKYRNKTEKFVSCRPNRESELERIIIMSFIFFIVSIGLESMGGLEPDIGIKQLHSALFHKEVTDSIIKPVKETLYTGKSLVSWTRSFRNWMFGSAS